MLIAVSGIDGSGKSTQLELVKQHFENKGKTVHYLWTRGGSTPGINAIKALSRKLAGKKLPPPGYSKKRDEMLGRGWIQRVWLSLAILDLMRIYCISIRWWILRGKVVICDRYLWDTQIDFEIMFPHIKIEDWLLWKILVRLTPVPDKPVLLMIPSKMSADRCAQKYDPFPDTPERRRQRYELYKTASILDRWKVIDATRSVTAVFGDIVNDNVGCNV
jgi:thymidylate kinase